MQLLWNHSKPRRKILQKMRQEIGGAAGNRCSQACGGSKDLPQMRSRNNNSGGALLSEMRRYVNGKIQSGSGADEVQLRRRNKERLEVLQEMRKSDLRQNGHRVQAGTDTYAWSGTYTEADPSTETGSCTEADPRTEADPSTEADPYAYTDSCPEAETQGKAGHDGPILYFGRRSFLM